MQALPGTDGQSHIFIVDDDATMRLLMKETLLDSDYILEEFENGMDALAAIPQSRPDMILLDVKMPGMSGFDVCTEIRQQYGDTNISVVMVTGLDDFESIEKAFQLGATAFINKPINWITFPYQIQYLLKARTAFVAVKQRELSLEHMERISRALTQSRTKEVVLQDALREMLDIFDADRACIFSTLNDEQGSLILDCEALREGSTSIKNNEDALLEELGTGLLKRARGSEFPLITFYQHSDATTLNIRHQMIRLLHQDDELSWFIAIHKCHDNRPWSAPEHETFYRICARLGTVMSRYMLTEKLHHSELLLQQAQRIGHIGNWRWNVRTGQLSCSDEVYRIFGFEPGSFIPVRGKFLESVFEEDHERTKQFWLNEFNSGETRSIEYRIVLPDRDIRWLHEQVVVGARDDEGQLIEINGTVQDITERRRQQEKEVHDHKMEAIGQLTSGVAHDFGNLMTVAKGNLELLNEMLKGMISGEAMEILEDASSAILDGVELTRQLLAISRKKSLVADYINIGASVNSFSKLLKNSLGANIRLEIDIEPELPDIMVDSTQFESSLLNVVINARDAMPDGGELMIRATKEQGAPVSADTGIDNEQVVLSISDTGTGMNSSVLQHAIDPFYTTKNNGTGLGLSMVYGFMRQSGGELGIESSPGKGTTLKMKFPIHGGKFQDKPQVVKSPPPRLSSATVLVVEDRLTVRQFAVRCLKQLGLNIIEAENADQAQEIISSNNQIDLLFTDILMPGTMNGRALATWAHEHHPGIKILLTTASERQAVKLHPGNQPGFRLLQKPYGKDDLLEIIQQVL